MIDAILLPVLGAFISRWHGGGYFDAPKVLKNMVWAVPFALMVLSLHGWFYSLLAFILCVSGKSSGHGGGIDLGSNTKLRKPEKIEYLIFWLDGKVSYFWYDFILLSLIGFMSVSGGLLLGGWYAIPITAGGLLKGAAYWIGRELYSDPSGGYLPEDLDEKTEIGEFLSGFFAYAGLSIAWVMM